MFLVVPGANDATYVRACYKPTNIFFFLLVISGYPSSALLPPRLARRPNPGHIVGALLRFPPVAFMSLRTYLCVCCTLTQRCDKHTMCCRTRVAFLAMPNHSRRTPLKRAIMRASRQSRFKSKKQSSKAASYQRALKRKHVRVNDASSLIDGASPCVHFSAGHRGSTTSRIVSYRGDGLGFFPQIRMCTLKI